MDLLFLIDKSLRIAAAIQLVYFLFLISPKLKTSTNHKLLALFAFTVISYLLVPFSILYTPMLGFFMVLLLIGAWSCGYLTWIMAKQFFDDEFKFGPLHLIVFLINQLFSFSIAFQFPKELYRSVYTTNPSFALITTLFFPQAFSLLFAVLAIRNVLANKENDLLEARRTFRGKFISMFGMLIVIIVSTEVSAKFFKFNLIPDIITSTFVILMTFWMNHFSSTMNPWEEIKKTEILPDEKKNYQDFPLKVISYLDQNKFYQDPEMSVSKLADQIGCPEYKLRNYINQTLGFKNFNDFLNQHRVKEACAILGDKTKNDIPIYNLGLDLGFGSTVSFNRAFKKITGTTPTEYRNQTISRDQ